MFPLSNIHIHLGTSNKTNKMSRNKPTSYDKSIFPKIKNVVKFIASKKKKNVSWNEINEETLFAFLSIFHGFVFKILGYFLKDFNFSFRKINFYPQQLFSVFSKTAYITILPKKILWQDFVSPLQLLKISIYLYKYICMYVCVNVFMFDGVHI